MFSKAIKSYSSSDVGISIAPWDLPSRVMVGKNLSCVSSVYRNCIDHHSYIIYITDTTAINNFAYHPASAGGIAKRLFTVISFAHNNQSKSFNFKINQQLFPLWLLQIVLFITGAPLRNLPTAAGNTWLNQKSNDAQNVPLCGNTQSLEQKAWASTEKLNAHVLEKWNPVRISMLFWACMNVPDTHTQKKKKIGEDYLSASEAKV